MDELQQKLRDNTRLLHEALLSVKCSMLQTANRVGISTHTVTNIADLYKLDFTKNLDEDYLDQTYKALCLDGEKWAKTNIHDELYISSKGRCLRLKPTMRYSIINRNKNNNYYILEIDNSVYRVKIADTMATHFLPNPNNYTMVEVDGELELDNLRWVPYRGYRDGNKETNLTPYFKELPKYEEWKDVPDTGGLVEVSNHGRFRYKDIIRCGVIVKKGRAIKINNSKTLTITYTVEGKRLLHKSINAPKVVASLFIPNPNNYSNVKVIDGNNNNFSVEKLVWVDRIITRPLKKYGVVSCSREYVDLVIKYRSLSKAMEHLGRPRNHSVILSKKYQLPSNFRELSQFIREVGIDNIEGTYKGDLSGEEWKEWIAGEVYVSNLARVKVISNGNTYLANIESDFRDISYFIYGHEKKKVPLAALVYRLFREKDMGRFLYFLDGDKRNNRLNNLTTNKSVTDKRKKLEYRFDLVDNVTAKI